MSPQAALFARCVTQSWVWGDNWRLLLVSKTGMLIRMKLSPLLRASLFLGSSAAGLALALLASREIADHRWPEGLRHAGWSIYLVLLPFINYLALGKVAGRPVSAADAKSPALRLLPGKLGFVGLLGLALLIAGCVAEVLG